jgi:hypothetical protein
MKHAIIIAADRRLRAERVVVGGRLSLSFSAAAGANSFTG